MIKRAMTGITLCCLLTAGGQIAWAWPGKDAIQHDAEHYMLLAQHGERWAAEDKTLEAKLAEVRKANGGKPPNIFFILIDDVGFGEMGIPELNHVRGYTTPNINSFAR